MAYWVVWLTKPGILLKWHIIHLKLFYKKEQNPVQVPYQSLSKCWEGQVPVVNWITQRVLNDTFYSFTCLSEQTTENLFFSQTKKVFSW